MPLVYYSVPKTKQEELTQYRNEKNEWGKWITSSVVKVIISGLLLSLLFQGMLASTLSLVIGSHYSETISLLGFTVGAAALAGIIQGIRWAWEPFLATKFGQYSDGKYGRLLLFVAFLTIAGFTFLLIPFAFAIYIWLAVVLTGQVSATILTTLSDALASDVAKQTDRNRVITCYTVFLDIGAAFGPLISYMIMSLHHGIIMTYMTGAVIIFSLALLWSVEYLRGRWRPSIKKKISNPV
ncbi:hypothetical protein J2S00_001257 [Caldalkalibacillus uzonensis]|uniref:MFS transporter n=1 Tax=Caldalkalibacillus uzonensis TaxID=353224 RepID=A0ABU0CPY2_9BACI|nr:MFS transporter [Caldalkalibacillus uzonensis]MDQ0338473.1 hypothetical protein [Caldalkalibacillus uzonensis]